MMLAMSTVAHACRSSASARPGRTLEHPGRRVIPAAMARRRARAVAVRSVDDAKADDSSAEVDVRADEEAEQPRRTFGSDVEAIAARGLAGALPEVDERLRIAMRGEAAGSRADADADALDAKRAAARAEDQAVDIVACLKQTGALRGYGAARLVPRRDYALSELKLNGIEAENLLSPTESTISGLRDVLGRAALVLVGGWVLSSHPSGAQVTGVLASGAAALAMDQVAFAGGLEALALDTLAQATSQTYVARLRLHEAAHFLVAYLMGILPKGYTLSSADAYREYGALNVQAGCAFCDGAFQAEVAKGKITSGSLGRFSCVALAGIGMEYVAYGFAEGGVADVRQLDGMLRALAFSQKKSDSEVRWAVLNTISILRRHEGTVRKLSERMAAGASVGECIRLIEDSLGDDV